LDVRGSIFSAILDLSIIRKYFLSTYRLYLLLAGNVSLAALRVNVLYTQNSIPMVEAAYPNNVRESVPEEWLVCRSAYHFSPDASVARKYV